jgi:hypothetical protein
MKLKKLPIGRQTFSELRKALKSTNLEAFENSLISIFASIPYNNYAKNSIAHYEEEALNQTKNRNYHQEYLNEDKRHKKNV